MKKTGSNNGSNSVQKERLIPVRRQKFYLGVRRLLEHSTVHGLSHVSTASSRIGRSIWLILWLAGVAGFFTNLSFIVSRYMTRPVLTSYKHDHESFIWPDITLCNPMAPYPVHLRNRTEKWNELRLRATRVAKNISEDLFAAIDDAEQLEIAIQALLYSTISPEQFGVGEPQELIQFVAADKGRSGIHLTVEMYSTFTDLDAPKTQYFHAQMLQKRHNIPCYTLQLAHVLSQEDCLSTNQVSLGLKFNHDSFLIINSSYAPRNIDLFISLPGHFPEDESMELLSGYTHKVSVSMTRFIREPNRLPCRTDEFVAQMFDANLKTRREIVGSADFCHKLVSQRLYINNCGCYSPFLPYPVVDEHLLVHGQPVLCFNMSHFNITSIDQNAKCMYDVYTQYHDHSVYMNLPEAQYCETFRSTPPCESTSYMPESLRRTPIIELWSDTINEGRTAFLTSTFESVFGPDLPEERIRQLLNNSGNNSNMFTYMRNNFGMVTISRKFPRGTLTHEELEYPLSELLSDLGGLMGLWIGISVIGLFEVVELLAFVSLSMISALIERCYSSRSRTKCSTNTTDGTASATLISADLNAVRLASPPNCTTAKTHLPSDVAFVYRCSIPHVLEASQTIARSPSGYRVPKPNSPDSIGRKHPHTQTPRPRTAGNRNIPYPIGGTDSPKTLNRIDSPGRHKREADLRFTYHVDDIVLTVRGWLVRAFCNDALLDQPS
ncbi:unnamed protein product [Echinostoma caproni]|uniref:Amiloride-sensitive sodium channel n=1 Tax=Echinostoma caproni TaxID=27848 RepID=A0A183A5V1_9TREM|nr:unnamed protein product [Echinostoma caproni]